MLAALWRFAFAMTVLSATASAFYIIFVMCLPFLIVFAWSYYIESRRPYPDMVRRLLALFVLILTVWEWSFISRGALLRWTLPVILVVNSWGFLDAVLRFPVIHDLNSNFTMKNCILLGVKVILLPIGCSRPMLLENTIPMIGMAMFNLVGIPALYLIALPLDDDDQQQREKASDVVDVDVAKRAYLIARNGERRASFSEKVKKSARNNAKSLLGVPVIAKAAEALTPKSSPRNDPKGAKMI